MGRVLEEFGHEVVYLNRGGHVPRGSADELVSVFAEVNNLILVAIDGDMRRIATGHGVNRASYRTLDLLQISCPEPDAAGRIRAAMSLIEHEWQVGTQAGGDRRLFVEIRTSVIRTNR